MTNLAYGTKSENAQDTIRYGNNPHSRKTHCKWGHPFDEVNTYVRPTRPTQRVCLTCKKAAGVTSTQKRRNATACVAS